MAESIYILPIIGVIGEDFKYTDVLMHLSAAKDSQYIKLVIASPGGYIDEGEKIREALVQSKKVMFATNSGDVASYAVSLFTVAPRQNRTFDPAKGVFLIHLPFVGPEDGVSGTADELDQIAQSLKKLEKNIISEYSKATGTDTAVLEGFMSEDTPLTPEQVETLGFATVKKQEYKAVALYKSNTDMTNEEVKTKLTGLESLMKKVLNFIRPKSLMVQDVNGVELDFGAAIETPDQIAAGATATVEGAPAQGEYTLASGEVYKFEGGVLTEVVPPAGNELETLKTENAALKTEIENMKAQIAASQAQFESFKGEAEKQVKEVTEAFKLFKNQFSTGDPKPGDPKGDPEPPATRKAFKTKS